MTMTMTMTMTALIDVTPISTRSCSVCDDGDGGCVFPYYGVAPHDGHGPNGPTIFRAKLGSISPKIQIRLGVGRTWYAQAAGVRVTSVRKSKGAFNGYANLQSVLQRRH